MPTPGCRSVISEESFSRERRNVFPFEKFEMASESIVACPCGARVRIPEGQVASVFRCPICKGILTANVASPVVSAIQIVATNDSVTCPICQTPIQPDAVTTRCPDCDQVHHEECWSEIGGCGTYGCLKAPQYEKPVDVVPTRAWGDTKICPVCGETIKSISLRCRYCRTDFHTVDPLNLSDLRQASAVATAQQNLRFVTLSLFILSLLGCTSPIAGLIGSAYLMPKAEQLRKCGPLYLVLAWLTFIVSGLFTVLIAVFLIFEWT